MRQPAIIDQIVQRLGPYKPAKGGMEYLFCCPYCNTKPKMRLSVNPHRRHKAGKGMFQCWHCGRKGSLRSLCRKLGIEYESVGVGDVTEFDAVIGEIIHGKPEKPTGRVDYSLMAYEDYYPYIPQYTQAYQYMLQRGFTHDDMTRYRFGLGLGRLKNRVVLPEFEGEEMTFWQARSYTGREPKYISPTGDRDGHVWNLYRVALIHRDVVAAEGIFSSAKSGDNGVGLYSYNYLPGQVTALVAANFETYTLAFDGHMDAWENAYNLAGELITSGIDAWRVRLAILPFGRDPDDVGRQGMRYVLQQCTYPWEPDLLVKICGGQIQCPDVKMNANCQEGRL